MTCRGSIVYWTTPDPLGMVDGPNLYAYLNNDPLNSIDPWGLCEGTGFGGWDLIFDLSTFSDSLKLFGAASGPGGDPGLQTLSIVGMAGTTVDAVYNALSGGAKGAAKSIVKKGLFVIGENMKRVKAFAKAQSI